MHIAFPFRFFFIHHQPSPALGVGNPFKFDHPISFGIAAL